MGHVAQSVCSKQASVVLPLLSLVAMPSRLRLGDQEQNGEVVRRDNQLGKKVLP